MITMVNQKTIDTFHGGVKAKMTTLAIYFIEFILYRFKKEEEKED